MKQTADQRIGVDRPMFDLRKRCDLWAIGLDRASLRKIPRASWLIDGQSTVERASTSRKLVDRGAGSTMSAGKPHMKIEARDPQRSRDDSALPIDRRTSLDLESPIDRVARPTSTDQ